MTVDISIYELNRSVDMLQKITDMWPNLLRRGGADQSDTEEPLLSQIDDQSNGDGMLEMDEEVILFEYKNLYWTRLFTVENFEDGQERKFSMGPDVYEECQAVADLPAVDFDGWIPNFEPHDFNEAYGPLEIEGYRLSPEDLRSWAD